MRWLGQLKPVRSPKAERPTPPGSRRNRLAVLVGLVTIACLGAAFLISNDSKFLMPGPLTSAHGSLEKCSTCHTKSGNDKLSWTYGLVAGDPHADSKACLSCHKMADTAFNAHGAPAEVLKQSTKRMTKIAAETPTPQSARAQSIAFPTHGLVARGLSCSTCHQEHKGANFDLSQVSNAQCRSCHEVKFDSFDGHHPKFENYPFKRRTPIIYDHAGHSGKHFPEVAKKYPGRRIPETCSTCHNSGKDKRVMAVAPFEQTCTSCHLDQISGKERASGPKGIAFLSLPGLDLQTLKKKNAPIGEWPDASDADITPFMKVMISRNEGGAALLETVDGLNLQDLSEANDDQIRAVTDLVWEIKELFHGLIKGKASDVLGALNIGGGAKLSANLVADLTANIPREVVIGVHQQWLPNLATEMAKRPATSAQEPSGWQTVITESKLGESAPRRGASGSDARQSGRAKGAAQKAGAANAKPDGGKETRSAKKLPPPMRVGIKNAQDAAQAAGAAKQTGSSANTRSDLRNTTIVAEERSGAISGRLSLPNGTPRAIEARNKNAGKAAQPAEAVNSQSDEDKDALATNEQPSAVIPPREDVKKAERSAGPAGETDTGGANGSGTAEQSDDLLFPTSEELRAMKADAKEINKSADGKAETAISADGGGTPDATASASAPAAAGTATALRVINIESDVDPERWAEYGGWYRQDYTVFYRPTGHKDKFIYSWLFLTGPQAPKDGKRPAAAVFDFLTSKDAQGSCTKCHSVDDLQNKGRIVNFSPTSVESKQGRFTTFVHEPHFGILEDRGCLTCHNLERGRPYLKGYEQGNPQNFASNFGAVKKDLCQTCHTSSMARQDCLLCHKYHVNGVTTPIMDTKIPRP